MTTLGNTPNQQTLIKLEARKAFSLGLWIKDFMGRSLNITGVEFRFVMRKTIPATDFGDSTNLLINSLATLVEAEQGFAQFDFQATDLDHKPGEYLYAIVMVSNGYPSVIVKGIIDVQANTEFSSLSDAYTPGGVASTTLDVLLQEQNAVTVYAGSVLAPGLVSFTQADKDKLDGIEAGATLHPPVILTIDDVILDMDDFADSPTRIAMTPAERTKLAAMTGSTSYNDLTDKPTLGTAAAAATTDFLPSSGINGDKITTGVINKDRLPKATGLNGTSRGTAAPSGGADADWYRQYTP
jgi:hypothetical protein